MTPSQRSEKSLGKSKASSAVGSSKETDSSGRGSVFAVPKRPASSSVSSTQPTIEKSFLFASGKPRSETQLNGHSESKFYWNEGVV